MILYASLFHGWDRWRDIERSSEWGCVSLGTHCLVHRQFLHFPFWFRCKESFSPCLQPWGGQQADWAFWVAWPGSRDPWAGLHGADTGWMNVSQEFAESPLVSFGTGTTNTDRQKRTKLPLPFLLLVLLLWMTKPYSYTRHTSSWEMSCLHWRKRRKKFCYICSESRHFQQHSRHPQNPSNRHGIWHPLSSWGPNIFLP